MSDESDEFFDAGDDTQPEQCPKNELVRNAPFARQNKMSTNETDEMDDRKKFSELRRRIQSEDDEILTMVPSTPASRTSSIDSDVPASKSVHPFRVIEQHDDTFSAKSLNSLIKQSGVANASGRKTTAATANVSFAAATVTWTNPQTVFVTTTASTVANVHVHAAPEPDVIASAKKSFVLNNQASVQFENEAVVTTAVAATVTKPVPPPRLKRKPKLPSSTADTIAQTPNHTLSNRTHPETPKLEQIKSNYDDCIKNRIDQLKLELLNTKSSCVKNDLSPDQDSSGRNSLGPHRSSKRSSMFRNRSERRRSAGDEDIWKQLSIVKQSVSNDKFTAKESGAKDSSSATTVNAMLSGSALEADERMLPATESEHKIPQCINPLSLEIMRLTSKYVSNTSIEKMTVSDNESVSSKKSETVYGSDDISLMCSGETASIRSKKGKKEKIRHLFDVTMKKAKSIAQATHKEALIEIVDEANPKGCEEQIKLKAAHSHKGPYEFQNTEFVQNLNDEHVGAIWCMKFSNCGRLLATAGQDGILRVWVIYEAFQYFQDMRKKYSSKTISPTPSQESLNSSSYHDAVVVAAAATASDSITSAAGPNLTDFVYSADKKKTIFVPKPFCTYSGHTSDLLDVAWSKSYFILSSSMDKTVRLWHISRKECLCVFHHIDFVTAIAFLPKDDRYFLSGSLDGKLRLWDIPDKKVAVWNEVDGQSKLITAANFCENGKFAVVGTYDGRCIFYTSERLKYHTQIHVRSTRGRNATGRKISGIEPMPGEDKILVTSNDSRVRLYDLRDLSLSCKYKGAVNISSQIKACFSHDGKFIVCGSENRDIYIWKTHHDYSTFSSVRRDRNVYWEAIKAHHATVTCAIFAPNPDSILQMLQTNDESVTGRGNSSGADSVSSGGSRGRSQTDHLEDPLLEQHRKGCGGHVLVSADFNGSIKVFVNRMKPKHSSLPLSALS